MQLEKEVKELPKVIRELITMISEYEAEKGSIYINGDHFLDILKQEDDALRPRSVRIRKHFKYRLCLQCIQDSQQDGRIGVVCEMCTIWLCSFQYLFENNSPS